MAKKQNFLLSKLSQAKKIYLSFRLSLLRFSKRGLELFSSFFKRVYEQTMSFKKRRVFLYFFKKNPDLEAKHRRYERERSYNKFVRKTWDTAYEQGEMERVLQPATRDRETEGSDEKKASINEKEREELETIRRLKTLIESEDFKLFLEILKSQEEFVLEELITGRLKSDKLTNDEYTFFLRGQLEVFAFIKQKIKSIIEEYAIRTKENRE